MMALVHPSFCFHPSLHVLSLLPLCSGSQGMLDRVAPSTSRQFITGPQHPFALTSTASLELPINLTRTSFVCGRRPENPLTTHTDSGRTGKFDCMSFFALFFFQIFISYCIFHRCIYCFVIHLCGLVFDHIVPLRSIIPNMINKISLGLIWSHSQQ